MTRRYLIVLLFILVVVPTSVGTTAEPERWTLDRCTAEALSHSHRLAISQEAINSALADSSEAQALRRGSFELGGNYGYISKTQSLDLALPLPPGTKQPHIQFGDGNSYDFAAIARAPIYAGGALQARAEAATIGVEATRHDLANDSIRSRYEVRTAYFAASGAELRLKTAREAADRLQRHLTELDSAIKLGAGSLEARLQAAGRLDQASESVAMAEGDLKAARLNLGTLVGKPGEEIACAGGVGLESDTTGFVSPDLSLTKQSNRPDLAAIHSRINQSSKSSDITRAAWLPNVAAVAAFHYARPGVDAIKNDWMNYYTIGLSASWTAFDWGARDRRIEKAEAARRSLQIRLSDATDMASTAISSAEARLKAALAADSSATERAEKEARRLKMVENRQKLGAATESELLDAMDDLAAAENERDAALIRVRMAEADLFRAGSSSSNYK